MHDPGYDASVDVCLFILFHLICFFFPLFKFVLGSMHSFVFVFLCIFKHTISNQPHTFIKKQKQREKNLYNLAIS